MRDKKNAVEKNMGKELFFSPSVYRMISFVFFGNLLRDIMFDIDAELK